jgi:hypothetical protein
LLVALTDALLRLAGRDADLYAVAELAYAAEDMPLEETLEGLNPGGRHGGGEAHRVIVLCRQGCLENDELVPAGSSSQE